MRCMLFAPATVFFILYSRRMEFLVLIGRIIATFTLCTFQYDNISHS